MDPRDKANDVDAVNKNSSKESLKEESLQEVNLTQETVEETVGVVEVTPEAVEAEEQTVDAEKESADIVEQAVEPIPEKADVASEQVADAVEPVVEKVTEQAPKAPEQVAETLEQVAEAAEPKTGEVKPVVKAEPVADTVEQVEEAPEQVADEAEKVEEAPEQAVDLNTFSRQELVDHLRQLLTQEITEIRQEVDLVKQLFYKKLKAENEERKKEFLESGGEELEYQSIKDGLDEELKSLLGDYRAKRAALKAKLEADKEQNLLEKQHIINRMKLLVESNDDVSSFIGEFRDLQRKWKTIGHVPPQFNNELWKSYNNLQETFWDLVKINKELREYDFKKNLEAKTELCEEAERLAEEEDVLLAFRQLQKLHDDWRETGPVAREYREEIWNRFKAASTIINRKHQGHFDEVRKIEEENLRLKIALCEKIEAFDVSSLNTYKAWDEATKVIFAWQEEWRSIGFAPRKMNHKVFDRYRKACDVFFDAKSEFYKAAKGLLNENLEKKIALCEKAEQLKDSTDWKETTEAMIRLQKEWKTIGPVPRKFSDETWKRFIGACDYFFEQKKKNMGGQRKVELENLKLKQECVQKINALDTVTDKTPEEILLMLREYIAEWNEIGHVPYRDKDKMYKEYRAAIDKMFEKLNVDANQRRLDIFKTNLKDMSSKGENKLLREREKLMRTYEHLKSEIATYENNIGFLSSTNKKGSSLIKEMERKIESLKEEARLVEQKISMIDDSL